MTDLLTQPLDLSGLSPSAKMELRWLLQAREEQLAPPGDWLIWFLKGGRGMGKTRTGAEDTAHYARRNPGCRQAIVAPTFGVGRDVCVEGESGLQRVLHKDEIAYWNRSEGVLVHRNGSHWKIFGSTNPERLRGPQHHRAWCEEFAAWQYLQDTWDMLMFGLRLGRNPQAVITSTPKPYRLVKDILSRTTTHVTSGSTFDNAANLAPAALDELRRRYEGSTLGRQELHGEVVEDVDGALWRRVVIEDSRCDAPEQLDTVVVAVDIATTSNQTSDETGIIVTGRAGSEGFVLDDLTLKAPPEVWGAAVVHAFLEWEADLVVYEANQGGDLVASVIRQAAVAQGVGQGHLRLKAVHASRGKRTRAEPVAQLYTAEGGRRMHHTRAFPELEDQMCHWVPGEDSPDRMDALVWSVHGLGILDDSRRRQLRYTG